jgi:flagellar biosynthesis GTPase FlhF
VNEWHDNQKQSSCSLRKLLQERIEKANPRRNLTAAEAKRLAQLEAISDKLRRGENVQNRQLQTWLSEDEYAQIEAEWQEQLALREELNEKPSELKRYEEKLKKAQMMRNRADAYHRKGRKVAASSLDAKCESVCEDAMEILHEIFTADPSLQLWFDRELDFAHGSLIDANLSSLPRLVTSRSNEKQRGDIRAMSKREVKLSVVERALQAIGRDEKAAPIDAKGNLRDFLQALE